MTYFNKQRPRLAKERWYAGFSCRENAKGLGQMLDLISQKVNEFDLSNIVPLIRVEKQDDNKGKKSFYLFVAIESEIKGTLPPEFQDKLQPLPCFRSPIKGANYFTYEQIKSMVGPAHKIDEYTNPIPFKEIVTRELYDPLADIEIGEREFSTELDLIKLVDWLSAKGYGSWATFQSVCQSLSIENPAQVMRNLKLLGHLETSSNGKKWSIAPTALIPLNDNSENLEFYLCGQQNAELRQQLTNYAEIKSEGQLVPFGLPRWRITFQDYITYQKIELLVGVSIYKQGNIAQQLVDYLPNIQEWQVNLPKIGGIVSSQYDWRQYQYQTKNFQNCILPEQTGFYEMRRDPEQKFPDRTVFYEADTQIWRQSDWYGLRFLALYHEKVLQECCYSSEQKQLRVPYDQRWPQIYERVLVLASGYLPQIFGDRQWLNYHNISPELANSLCKKLSLSYQGI
ncbi:hypothetical protein NON20_14460 [Synechocystis sp. B12]|nr:hypothetical protein NON20_14460 [Synechocystis sp. B12]